MLKDLWDAAKRINPKKAIDVYGMPDTAVRVLIEESAEEVLRVLNAVNAKGKISTKRRRRGWSSFPNRVRNHH